MALKIYHNPRCSKSRQALALLEEQGAEPEVVEYLKTPLTKAELAEVIGALGRVPHDAVRTKEDAYAASGLNPDSDLAAVCAALAAEPILLERPIVVKDSHAVIGRPPEDVLGLLGG
tara:strand:+ start:1417 stop:1767 length:351 start_codon:yes stop_codon:yes gene_type:complete